MLVSFDNPLVLLVSHFMICLQYLCLLQSHFYMQKKQTDKKMYNFICMQSQAVVEFKIVFFLVVLK